MTIVHVTLQFPIYSYYPENTVSVDPSLVCIVINRGIRTPPHLGNAFTAYDYYSPLSRMPVAPS